MPPYTAEYQRWGYPNGGGECTLKHWSTTQSTIAISSGEAELGGIVKGASLGLGFQSMAADLGLKINVRVHSDSSAAIGISRRKG